MTEPQTTVHMTEAQRDELIALVAPVQKWMGENCHPHMLLMVDSVRANLMEGVLGAYQQDTAPTI